jgi:hypothetical protein
MTVAAITQAGKARQPSAWRPCAHPRPRQGTNATSSGPGTHPCRGPAIGGRRQLPSGRAASPPAGRHATIGAPGRIPPRRDSGAWRIPPAPRTIPTTLGGRRGTNTICTQDACGPVTLISTMRKPLNLKNRIAWTVFDGCRRLRERSATVRVSARARGTVRGTVDGRRRGSAYPRSHRFRSWKDVVRP